MDFQGQYGPWALISGASAGLGEEFARQLAAKGLNLVLLARRRDRLEALGSELKQQHGIDCRVVSADLADPDFLAPVADQTDDLDIGLLVNNAGFTNSGHFLDNDLEAETRLIDVNCRAAAVLAHHYGRLMRARGRGGIIVTASMVGFVGIPIWATYSASKSFDLLFAEALASELKPHGVDVLALCPGATNTEFATYEGPIAKLTAMSAEPVVTTAIKNLGRRRTVVAGWMNKLNVFFTRLLPRSVNSWLFGKVIRDIVKH